MDRLTKCVGYQNGKPIYKTNIDMRRKGALDKLKNALGKYEDADESGLLLYLKVKPHDFVFSIINGKVCKLSVNEITYHIVENEHVIYYSCIGVNTDTLFTFKTYTNEDFGKEVFLTEEKALKNILLKKGSDLR